MEGLEREVIQTIAEFVQIEARGITPESCFVQDLGVDSIVALEIVSALEERYGVEIPDDRIREFTSVRDLIVDVRARLGGSSPS
jgi:acyl carrier protein